MKLGTLLGGVFVVVAVTKHDENALLRHDHRDNCAPHPEQPRQLVAEWHLSNATGGIDDLSR